MKNFKTKQTPLSIAVSNVNELEQLSLLAPVVLPVSAITKEEPVCSNNSGSKSSGSKNSSFKTSAQSRKKTITCAYCGCKHTYIQTRKERKFCSNKCGVSYHGKFVRNKVSLAARVTAYYTNNYAKRLIVSSKRSAKTKGFQHNLSEAHLNTQLATGKCQVTGLPVASNIGTGQKRGAYSPSLDRIDNNVGYIDSNVRIVSWQYNLAKGKFSDRDLNALAVAICASHLSSAARQEFKALLPTNLVANLPIGYTL